MQVKTYVKKVTPVLAADWLKKNTRNRPISKRTVDRYVDELVRGEWKLNGESVKFCDKGSLLDGQHRLSAIVTSGVSAEMVIVEGLDASVFDTLDQNLSRTAAHTCAVVGIPNHQRVVSALCVILAYERGVKRQVRLQIAPNRVLAALEDYEDLPQAIEEVLTPKMRLVPQSLFDGYYYLFRKSDAELAKDYVSAFRDGHGVDSLACWLQLRERLIRNVSATSRMKETQIAALMIKAWNFARRGQDTARLIWAPEKEDFPVII